MENYDHVFIDEFFDDFHTLDSKSKNDFYRSIYGKKTLWIASSGSHSNAPYNIDQNIAELSKKWFPKFQMDIVEMKIPLRSPKFVPDFMKSAFEGRVQLDLNALLLTRTNTPPTLTDGKKITIDIDRLSSLAQILKQCLDTIPKKEYALIIIEDSINYMFERCFGFLQPLEPFITDSFLEIGEEPPLYWLKTDQSPTNEIKK